MSNETYLDFAEIGIVPQSARGVGQTLTPIENGSNRRLANGVLVTRKRNSFEKFSSTITFTDAYPPGIAGLWKGDVLTVDCVSELSNPVGLSFIRTPVPGSVVWRDYVGRVVSPGSDETIAPDGATTVTWRPRIVFKVDGWDADTDEYGAVISTTLNLLEI